MGPERGRLGEDASCDAIEHSRSAYVDETLLCVVCGA